MNSRKRVTGWMILWVIMSLLGLAAPEVRAQAHGWCEQKSVVRATVFDQRVSMPVVAAEGDHVFIAFRQKNIKVIRSNDRGKTWSEPVVVGSKLDVTNAPAIAVNGSQVVVVFPARVDVQGFSAFQLFAAQSTDGGQTFSEPKQITETQEDTFSPRLWVNGDSAVLLWLETPLAQTLGNISSVARPDFSPESVEELFGSKIKEGSLEDRLTRVRSTLYTRSYSFSTGTFSPPNNLDVLRGQNIPHVFSIYGLFKGALAIAVNQNTEIRSYLSKDNGQHWERSFQDRELFDSRKWLDVFCVKGKRFSIWIPRTVGQMISVQFNSEEDSKLNAALSPDQYVRYVPRITMSDNVFHVVWEAGDQDVSWITYMRTDTIPPTSKITLPATPNLTARTAAFGWEGEDNISDSNRLVYAFSKDGGQNWSAPQAETQTTIDVPPDGEYIFKVRAEDVAGNIQEKPAEFPYNTFQSAPDTKITQSPPASVVLNKRSVDVAFTGEDNNDPPEQLQFSLQADESEWTSFAKGMNYTFDNLSNGQHVLRVRAQDSRGNIDSTPAQCMVTVQVGLELILSASPALSTNEDTILFGLSARNDKGEPVQLTYFYRLDKGSVQQLDNTDKLELKDLAEGRHHIEIWGRHTSGDETQKVTQTWAIDRTPPETEATFSKQYMSKFPVISLELTDPALQDGSTTTQPRKIQYRIGDGDWIDQDDVISSWPVPKPLPFYAWGYIAEIRAVDTAGNIDPTPVKVDLRIFARTNPYIFYGICAILAILILFLLRLLLKSMFSGSHHRLTTTSTPSFGSDSDKKDDGFSSSFSFDDDKKDDGFSFSFDDDDKKDKDNDPYSN